MFGTVWGRHARSPRLALPLLRTANLLYDDCGMHRLPATSDFPGEHHSYAVLLNMQSYTLHTILHSMAPVAALPSKCIVQLGSHR